MNQQILIPLDGSEHVEEILEPALALGDLVQAEYTLLRVVEPSTLAGYAPPQAVRLDELATQQAMAEAQHDLKRLARRLRATGRRVHTRSRLAAQPARAILAAAREWPTDLIALAAHRPGGVSRLLLGSVADSVRRGAELPVLMYCPQTPAHPTERRMEAPVAVTALPNGPMRQEAPAHGSGPRTRCAAPTSSSSSVWSP